jgi:hypothetical protein
MSLYREPGRRRVWPLLAAAAVLVVAVAVGFALGRATSDMSLEQALEPTRTATEEMLTALELVALHYPEDGEPSDAQLDAAREQVSRLNDGYRDAVRDLAIIAPDAVPALRQAIDEVVAAVDRHAPGGEVQTAVEQAERAVRRLPTAG